MPPVELVSEVDLDVPSSDGQHKIRFQANVPRPVPDFMVQVCRSSGAFPPNGLAGLATSVASNAPPTDANAVADEVDDMDDGIDEALLSAIAAVIAKGDPKLLKEDGVPKTAAVSKMYGGKVTAVQVTDAFPLVKTVSDSQPSS